MSPAPLVLASGSPRRAALLAQAGIAFVVDVPAVDEDGRTARAVAAGEIPAAIGMALARAKAEAVAARHPGARVLGADTLVVLDGALLGKPRDPDEALAMLSRLSGRSHEVITGLALVEPGGEVRTAFEATAVTFSPWPAAARAAYVAGGEPMDKAGAYALQGAAGAFVVRLDGCPTNVVGLPLDRVRRLLGLSGMPDGDPGPSP